MSGLSVPSFSLHCGQGNNPLKTIALYRVHACAHVRFVSPSPTTMKVALLENKGKGQVSQFALKVLHSSQNINGNTDCSYLQLPCPLVSISVHFDGQVKSQAVFDYHANKGSCHTSRTGYKCYIASSTQIRLLANHIVIKNHQPFPRCSASFCICESIQQLHNS